MILRLISYPLLTVALLLVVFTAAHVAFAERPDTCAPEDREVAGNINSDCKWDFRAHQITTVEYAVVGNAEGNSCREQLTLSPFNGTAEKDNIEVNLHGIQIDLAVIGANGEPDTWRLERWGYTQYAIFRPESIKLNVGYLHTLDDSVGEKPIWHNNGTSSYWYGNSPADFDALRLNLSGKTRSLNDISPWLPIPANVNDFNLLMNDCLAGIKQRLENEAKLEETRQQVEAERVAQERTAIQAAAEAERQRLETEAAREALRIVRETELAKTQALIEQLEREKIIIGIWQEVVVEKQTGAEARATITNQYLTEIEANAAEFKASVVAKAEEIRRLQEINAAITDAIIAHNDEVERQLVVQAEREAEQRARLDDLEIEPPETEAPSLTPTATP